jgi:hypothetical protein
MGRFFEESSYCRQPDSGNPTVRDERGACGNVNYGEGYTGTYSGNADTAKPLA